MVSKAAPRSAPLLRPRAFLIFFLALPIFADAFCNESRGAPSESEPTEHVANVDSVTEVSQGVVAHSIPIPLPDGPGSLRPELSIDYSSSGSQGVVGIGFGISAVSTIVRCRKTLAQDGKIGGVEFTLEDAFCLDGARLRNVSGGSGAPGAEYRSEIESFSRVKSVGVSGAGPASWTVETKDRRRMTFGDVDAARVHGDGQESIYAWSLTKVEDYFGNSVRYSYDAGAILTKIEYGRAVIHFAYEERPDPSESYLGGFLIENSTKRLTHVSVVNENVVLYNYKIGFNEIGYGGSKRSIVDEIKVCDRNDRCLKPLKFGYDGAAFRPEFEAATMATADFGTKQGWNVERHDRFIEDINGDGFADVVGFADSGVYVGANSGDGTFAEMRRVSSYFGSINFKKENPRFLSDVDGDGLPDIVGLANAAVLVAFNEGNFSFSAAQKMTSLYGSFTFNSGWRADKHPRLVMDVDNDGRADIVGFADRGVFVALSEGRQFGAARLWVDNYGEAIGWKMDKHVRTLGDVNGDGLPDIVGMADSYVFVSINTGSGFEKPAVWTTGQFTLKPDGWSVKSNPRMLRDVNGDGLADLVGFSCCSVQVKLNTGSSFAPSKVWSSEFGSRVWSAEDHPRMLEDVSGDGLPDVVGFADSGVFVAINQGSKFGKATRWNSAFGKGVGWRGNSHPRILRDVSGDGVADVVGFAATGVFVATGVNHAPRISSIVDSFGAKSILGYETLPRMAKTSAYSAGAAATYPKQVGVFPLPVVKSLARYTKDKMINETTFAYERLEIDLRGRGFLGFSSITSRTSTSNLFETVDFHTDFPLTGIVHRKTLSWKRQGKDAAVVKRSAYEYETPEIDGIVHVVLKSSKAESNDEEGHFLSRTTSKFSEYQREFGEFCSIVVVSEGNDNQTFEVDTRHEFESNTAKWILGNTVKSVVTHKAIGTPDIVKTMTFGYDNNTGAKVRDVRDPGKELSLESIYDYDDFGNLIRHTEAPTGEVDTEGRVAKFVFDEDGILMTSRSNALGHTETFEHDARGNVVRSKGPNGILTRWEYNEIGKMVTELRSDETSTKWKYKWNEEDESYRLVKEVQGFSPETRIYDINDRLVKIVNLGAEDQKIVQKYVYNERGLLKKQSAPANEGDQVLWEEYEYDDFGRVVREKRPGGGGRTAETQFRYDGLRTTEIDPKGNAKVTEVDILGRIVSLTDANGAQNVYEYDAVGNLLKVLNAYNVPIVTAYDNFGNKKTVDDPHMGIWSYKHNAYGELVRQIDAVGNVINQTFDKLGRKVSKTDIDGKAEWTYDGKNGIGKLAIEKSPGMEKAWLYDKFGREDRIITKVQVDGEIKVYEIENIYDNFGRLITQKYPNGKEVHRCYNSNGFLLRVQNVKCSVTWGVYWEALKYDAKGKVVKERHGNGMSTKYEYDNADNLLKIETTTVDGTEKIRDLRYEYDLNHNLLSRSLDESTSDGSRETFIYDNMDRLLRASLVTVVDPKNYGYEQNWAYDLVGNIVSDDAFGLRHFKYTKDKPHAVKKAGKNKYEYNANGNIIDRNGMKISWTATNKPKSFATEKSVINFGYDANGHRFMKKHDGETTINLGQLYEVKISPNGTLSTVFIYAHRSGYMVAMEKTMEEKREVNFVHTDNLGSVETITDKDGAIKQKTCYQAFGLKRNCFPLKNKSSEVTSKGFTGHDHLEFAGLIHMNGRVYDADIGRFLSPDPHIQHLYDTQGLNRYTYARNNPLKYDDPSGYFFKAIKRAFKKVVKFVKKMWRPILAVAATVVTAGAAAGPAAALVASVGLTGTTAAVATGALVGASSGFVGGTISTGTIQGGLKGALAGAITGGVTAGVANADVVTRIVGKATGQGLAAEATGGDFKDGFVKGATFASAKFLYKSVVGYDAVWESGKGAKIKGELDMPNRGYNNFGTQGHQTVDPSWFRGGSINFQEGGGFSRLMTKVPGMNAISGMHDVFQVNLDRVLFPGARDIFNVPGMPVAAGVTYLALQDSDTLGFGHYKRMTIDESRKSK